MSDIFNKDEIIETDDGTTAVLYRGLRRVAEDRGLLSIQTELKFYEGGSSAVCKAVAFFEGGKMFTGIGEASRKNNGNPPYSHFPVSISETRAKARALREALGVDLVAFEELSFGDNNGADEVAEEADLNDEPSTNGSVTEGQRKALNTVLNRLGLPVKKTLKHMGWEEDKEMTSAEANAYLKDLHSKRFVNSLKKELGEE